MAKKTKQKNDATASTLFDENERKQNTEYIAWKAALKNTRKWKILISLFLIIGFVSPIIAIRSYNSLVDVAQTLGELYKEQAADKPGRQAALEAVNSWLNSTSDTPFPSGVANIWWDGAEKVSEPADTSSDSTTYWSHHLSFTDLSDGSTRDVTQLVSVSGSIATPVGEPTILPKSVSSNTSQKTYTPDAYPRIDQSESLTNVVSAWAKAYVGKDVNAFTVLIGDPNSEHAYQPAMIGTYKSASINWLVQCDKDGNPVDKNKKTNDPDYGAASLTISFTPYAKKTDQTDQGADANAITSPGSSRMNITVLIKTPAKGDAKIVDWGADGAIGTLKPYANALSKTLLSSDSSSTDESASSDSSSSDSTATQDTTTQDSKQSDSGVVDDPNAGK
ncbi:hypothetical protein [Bifidobacterium sp. SO1]|uniref:hypothetical protein n=1 Tax=Bifidobacterium sp. SO1 TaxID=2809029 RepID=UPI001BDC003D|nr:hypothetical protein [Bifidobacterium sp. SO1]MBT1162139.1 hypothetical protein [Bifidobacterium sp. SO1]